MTVSLIRCLCYHPVMFVMIFGFDKFILRRTLLDSLFNINCYNITCSSSCASTTIKYYVLAHRISLIPHRQSPSCALLFYRFWISSLSHEALYTTTDVAFFVYVSNCIGALYVNVWGYFARYISSMWLHFVTTSTLTRWNQIFEGKIYLPRFLFTLYELVS